MKTRIIVFTNKHSWISRGIIQRIDDSPNFELVSVFLYKSRKYGGIYKRIISYGFRKTYSKLLIVFYNSLSRILGRFGIINTMRHRSSLRYIIENNIDHEIYSDFNVATVRERIKGLDPSIVVVCSFSQIIKSELLELPDIEYINIHDSLLPAHRGPSATFWALYNREAITGYTIHSVSRGIDEGTILYQEAFKIDHFYEEEELVQTMFDKAASKICTVIEAVIDGSSIDFERMDLKSSYESIPSRKQRKELLCRN